LLNTAVKVEAPPSICSEDAVIDLDGASNIASLCLFASRIGQGDTPPLRGHIALPVDPQLGKDDPNLRVLCAMQVAARAEIDRQRSSASARLVHVPQRLDLSDLRRFPSLVCPDEKDEAIY
jgi:hypothetical protein